MTTNGGGPTFEGIRLTGEGVRFTVDRGVSADTRSDQAVGDPVAAAVEASEGMRILETMTVRNLEVTARGGRDGGGAVAALVADLGPPEPNERRVVLVEEGARYTWAVPGPGEDRVRLPLEPWAAGRGWGGGKVGKVLRVLAVKTAGWVRHQATGTIVGGWDAWRHPHRLRTWTSGDFRDPNAPVPDIGALQTGPALLVIHGFTGSIHDSFGSLAPETVDRWHRAYDGRTFAFDHPTLVVSPTDNAQWLLAELTRRGGPLEVDILAHSRGGLVARELAQRPSLPGMTVRSITFVATPNNGTPLADPRQPAGLLDGLTNLAAMAPGGEVIGFVLELVKDIVLGSVLDGLQGLVAMTPGGQYLEELNGLPVREGLELRAVAADFEPRSDAGLVRTAHDRLIDAYFGGARNDLIVPTLSTVVTGGGFGVRAGARLILDSSRGVDHSGFWTNPRAVNQLTDWLRPDWPERAPARVSDAETDPAAETAGPVDPMALEEISDALEEMPDTTRKAVAQILGGPIAPGARKPRGDRRAVIIIPGVMGTHLRQAGKLIWVDPLRLMRGHFRRLSLAPPAEEVQTAGLHRNYLPLLSRLAVDRDVYMAPYDWRLDIRESANRLANLIQDEVLVGNPTREVHLVAHSMGGLVARSLMLVAPEVWSDLGAPQRGDSGRLVMLGCPNRGSFSSVLTLTGQETVMRALAAVDLGSDLAEVLRIVSTFPGLYQLLPAPGALPSDDDHAKLYRAAVWGAGSPVDQRLLTAAEEFHRSLEESHQALGPDEQARMVSVAGYGRPTPYRLEIAETGGFSMGRAHTGDGRVALPLNELDGVTRYFSRASHGSLPSAPAVLDSLEALFAGQPGSLEPKLPEPRGAEVIERPPMIPIALFDPQGAGVSRSSTAGMGRQEAEARLSSALSLSLGGGSVPSTRLQMKVAVVHASLEQARFPVAVGHYTGLPIGGTERLLCDKMAGALRLRQNLGQYPDRAGDGLYVPAELGSPLPGALVLGLGEFGSLTGATLSAAMTQGVIAMVLDARGGTQGSTVGVSSVLVGTPGRHDLTIEAAVTSLVEGVIEAVVRLRSEHPRRPIDAIEFEIIESYEQRAEEAAMLLPRLSELVAPRLREVVDLAVSDRLETRAGHQPGAPPGNGGGNAWVRVLVDFEPADASPAGTGIRRMTYSTLARGAQANVIHHDVNLERVRAFVDAAVQRPGHDPSVNRTLFEMLFPTRAKLDLDRSEHLHLIVDEETAQLPWELLAAGAVGNDTTPLALRAGMLRQLRSPALTRQQSFGPEGSHALFVGDPPTAYPRLPNAREEAERLATLFEHRDWDVERRIFGDGHTGDGAEWMGVLSSLHLHPYRVVHIAAHGVFDDDWRQSGVVLGPRPEHRLTALEFEAMSRTPDLVFLNCCHLGKLGSLFDQSPEHEVRALGRPHQMAGTVAQQLLRNGVRAVVVAGWTVDDFAAAEFATQLYEMMLDGYPFGDAVCSARQRAFEADGGRSNTWGAYQCYGDPDFELVSGPRHEAPKPHLVSAVQLARELDLAKVRASEAISPEHADLVERQVDILRDAGKDLADDGRALEALGAAFGELGAYQKAVDAYSQALLAEKGMVRLKSVEQLANLRGRLAMVVARSPGGSSIEALELLTRAEETLGTLEKLAGATAERHVLRGGLHKKRATILEGEVRHQALVDARSSYLAARLLSSPDLAGRLDPYHVNLWLQLTALTDDDGRLNDEEAHWLGALYRQVSDPRRVHENYWEAVALADTLLTYMVSSHPIGDQPVDRELVTRGYRTAFDLRSTVRERDSTLSHLQDLQILVPAKLAGDFYDLFQELNQASAAIS